jgi:hypothetical protein
MVAGRGVGRRRLGVAGGDLRHRTQRQVRDDADADGDEDHEPPDVLGIHGA